MKRFAFIVTAALIASAAQAQSPAAQTTDTAKAPPQTKLEAFSAKTGVVVIKGFATIGTVVGTGSVSIDAREFRDASNLKVSQYGIAISVKEYGRLERESTSYIDEDEVDSLIRGLDYISKMDKSVTALKDFEAQYRTKGDFAVTTFSDTKGGISVAVSSGRIGKTSAYLKLSDIDPIRNYILEAQKAMTAAKAGR